MEAETLLLFISLAFVAEILGTIGGFGSSLFFVPLAGFFFDFHSVLGITALFHIISNLTKIGFFRKGIDKKLIFTIGIPSAVLVIPGAYLSKYIDSNILEFSLAIFLILLSIFLIIFRNLKIKPTLFNTSTGGSVSGFIAGLIGTGGAIRGAMLSAYTIKMEIFIATSALIDLAIDSSRAVIYSLNGFVHKHDIYLIPYLLAASITGTLLGKKILQKISEERFKLIVLILVLITGIFTLLNFIYNDFFK